MKQKIIQILLIWWYVFIVVIISAIIASTLNPQIWFLFALVATWLFPLRWEKVFQNRFNDWKNRKWRLIATVFTFFILAMKPAPAFIVLNTDVNTLQWSSIQSYEIRYQLKNIQNLKINGQKIETCKTEICTFTLELKTPITYLNVENLDTNTPISYYLSWLRVENIKIWREKNEEEKKQEQEIAKALEETQKKQKEQEKIEAEKKVEQDKKIALEQERLRAEQIKKEKIALANRPKIDEKCFSSWNGTHINGEKVLKEWLNDPDSYEHIDTRFSDNGKVIIKFRAKNGFWGYIVSYMSFMTDADCSVEWAQISQ